MPSISSEPGDHYLPNLLLCSSIFSDDQYFIFLVCGYYHLIGALMFVALNATNTNNIHKMRIYPRYPRYADNIHKIGVYPRNVDNAHGTWRSTRCG